MHMGRSRCMVAGVLLEATESLQHPTPAVRSGTTGATAPASLPSRRRRGRRCAGSWRTRAARPTEAWMPHRCLSTSSSSATAPAIPRCRARARSGRHSISRISSTTRGTCRGRSSCWRSGCGIWSARWLGAWATCITWRATLRKSWTVVARTRSSARRWRHTLPHRCWRSASLGCRRFRRSARSWWARAWRRRGRMSGPRGSPARELPRWLGSSRQQPQRFPLWRRA
mmetsp:Transcript_79710/g.228776  ORF Transcript_79710/g.228776 Transcript_79710/m.228776 type:complete len:227 (+) Transcript_79710:196-876(+)